MAASIELYLRVLEERTLSIEKLEGGRHRNFGLRFLHNGNLMFCLLS
jgi:hypothetical protein